MSSVQAIVDEAKAARRNLADLETQLQQEIDEIQATAFREGRDLTTEERAIRTARRASLRNARAAYAEMAYVTLRRLNNADELAGLRQKMEQINTTLKGDLDRLKRIARYAQIAARVADSVAKVAAKMADLAA